jgi:Type I phosphodiesterase / nucleotide pyrophosphatase
MISLLFPRLRRSLALMTCLSLSAALASAAPATHVIQVSLDGLGGHYLQFFVTNAPAQFPNFVRLAQESAYTYNARCDHDVSETIPNHATMFTGRPVMQPAGQPNTTHHGYNNNFPGSGDTFHASGNAAVPYKSSFYDVAHDYGLSTAFYAGKTRLGICDLSYDAVNGGLDLVAEGGNNGKDKIDFSTVLNVNGANISNEVNTLIQDLTNAMPKRYSFIHIAEPDQTGHASGWRSAAWSNAVRNVDTQLGRILNAINANPTLSNNTALIVSADHGGGGVTPTGHTESYHVTNYTIPFFLRAPGIAGSSDIYALFSNRGNPGTNRTDYNTVPQPVRNGDGGNLALGLLGLPPIPGSFMVPAIIVPSVTLSIARLEELMSVFWTDASGDYILESREALPPEECHWEPITSGIVTNDTTRVYTITNVANIPPRYFRLRKPGP